MVTSLVSGLFINDEVFIILTYIAIFMGLNHLLYDLFVIVHRRYNRNAKKLHALHLILSLITLAVLGVSGWNPFQMVEFWVLPCLLALFFWYLTYFIIKHKKYG